MEKSKFNVEIIIKGKPEDESIVTEIEGHINAPKKAFIKFFSEAVATILNYQKIPVAMFALSLISMQKKIRIDDTDV